MFENPFQNPELDEDDETSASANLLSSFDQNQNDRINNHNNGDNDDDDSFDGEFLDSVQNFAHISNNQHINNSNSITIDNRLNGNDNPIENTNTNTTTDNSNAPHIDESLFAEAATASRNFSFAQGAGEEGSSANLLSNSLNTNSNTNNTTNSFNNFNSGNFAGSSGRSLPNRLIHGFDMMTSNSPGRKLLHKFFPQYISLHSSRAYNGQIVGNGLLNDGVFSNMMAKPTVNNADADLQNDVPPTYEEAAADSTPPYWESTVFSPYGDGVFVDGLPVGNMINFIWNLMVSSAFQFVGFLLTYLLHTSHAAKEGSRAGLGITFMSYGYYMIPDDHFIFSGFQSLKDGSGGTSGNIAGSGKGDLSKFEPVDPNNFDVDSSHSLEGSIDDFRSSINNVDSAAASDVNDSSSGGYFDENNAPIFAYGLVALGVFILIKSLLDYHRAKQMEKVILQSPSTTFETAEEV